MNKELQFNESLIGIIKRRPITRWTSWLDTLEIQTPQGIHVLNGYGHEKPNPIPENSALLFVTDTPLFSYVIRDDILYALYVDIDAETDKAPEFIEDVVLAGQLSFSAVPLYNRNADALHGHKLLQTYSPSARITNGYQHVAIYDTHPVFSLQVIGKDGEISEVSLRHVPLFIEKMKKLGYTLSDVFDMYHNEVPEGTWAVHFSSPEGKSSVLLEYFPNDTVKEYMLPHADRVSLISPRKIIGGKMNSQGYWELGRYSVSNYERRVHEFTRSLR